MQKIKMVGKSKLKKKTIYKRKLGVIGIKNKKEKM